MPTYTAPTTRTTGELISAAIFNTDLVENLKYFKDAPAFAGNVTVAGTLGVTGATTLSSTLGVTGLITSTGGITGGASSHTTGAFSSTVTGGTYNGQTISSAANFTGTLGVAGLLTVSGAGTSKFTASNSGAGQILGVINSSNTAGSFSRVTLSEEVTGNIYLRYNVANFGTTSGIHVAAGGSVEVDSAGGLSIASTNASGAIRFYSGGTTEAARFHTDGTLLINGASAVSSQVVVLSNQLARWNLGLKPTVDATNGVYIMFLNAAGTSQGSVMATNSTTTAYNTSSDQRLKRNLGIVAQTDVLRQTIVRDFAWLSDGSPARGVFAQEAYAVAPFAVSRGTDEVNAQGQLTRPWGVDYSKYVPDLIVGWQQHDATIAHLTTLNTQLAARIAALETKDN